MCDDKPEVILVVFLQSGLIHSQLSLNHIQFLGLIHRQQKATSTISRLVVNSFRVKGLFCHTLAIAYYHWNSRSSVIP